MDLVAKYRHYLAEFIGTFALVFCGTGAIVINDFSGGAIGHPGVAASFGLVVIAMIYTFGETSGAHINPAVTLGFWAAGRFKGKKVLPYITVQLLGALAASFLLKSLFPLDDTYLGATLPADTVYQTFVFEFLLTFLLMLVIIQVSSGSKEKGITAGLAIGFTVWLEALFAGPVSGASMNPARSIGPAVASGHFQHLWIYIVATILGALFAVLISKIFNKKES